jgi:uncharacterized protein YqgV (UPF0045/DUF77 family)
MTAQEYKLRLYSTLTRVESIVESFNNKKELDEIKERLASSLEVESKEEAKSELDSIKEDLISLLRDTLTEVQIAFVEMEEPDNSDTELFKKYMLELKEYRQDLTSHDSETRKKINTLLKHSKANLLNELSSQAIIFPTECLDTILNCPEVEQSNGADWVVQQINVALNSLLEEINDRLKETFDSANEIIGSEIDALESTYTQSISLSRRVGNTVSDDMFGVARQALPSLGIGSLGYGIAAIMLGPIAGLVAGLTAGGLFLWKSQSSMAKQKKISEIKQQLAPKITLAMNELKTYVLERYEEFEEGISESIKTMLTLIDNEMQDCIDALKSCDNDRKDFEAQQIQLNNTMNAMETYIKQLEILNTNPFENKNK